MTGTEQHRTEEPLGWESVYPIPERRSDYNEVLQGAQTGLTKRELYAAMAMQGIFAHGYTMPNESDEAARYAVQAADYLLKELAK